MPAHPKCDVTKQETGERERAGTQPPGAHARPARRTASATPAGCGQAPYAESLTGVQRRAVSRAMAKTATTVINNIDAT